MPNWCSNTMTLTHEDPAMIARAKAAFARGQFLQEFVPVPKALSETVAGSHSDQDAQARLVAQTEDNIKKYGYANWYDWANAEWGTKWGDYDGEVTSNDEHSTTAIYLSAWGPASELLAKVSALFPTLLFVTRYVDEGWGFSGVTAHRGGELLRVDALQDDGKAHGRQSRVACF